VAAADKQTTDSAVMRLRGSVSRRSGLWLEVISMALTALRGHKLRSSLTILGVVIGVATVIGMVSLIEGLNRSMQRQIQSFGTNTLYIRMWRPQVFIGGIPDSLRNRKAFTVEDQIAILESCDAVAAVSGLTVLDNNQVLRYQRQQTRPTFIIGTDDAYQETNGYNVEAGRFFTGEEVRRRGLVCLLGTATREALLGGADPVGKNIRIGRTKFEVVGVLEAKGNFLGNNLDEVVMIPHTTMTKHFRDDLSSFLPRGELVLNASAVSPERIDEAIQQITETLRARRGLRPNQPNNFAVITDDALMDLYNSITGAFYMAMVLIASIALLVGGIGVMNVMLISVTERTHEIGLRKAIGARRSAILWQFLFEAITLTALGGSIGIAVGLSIAWIVAAVSPLPSAVPLWSVVVGFGVSAVVGLFFGLYPAVRAAALDPVEALRYE
jgi:putative ABC transport system permease protein